MSRREGHKVPVLSAGKESREAFAAEFGVDELPTTERGFTEQTGKGELFADAGAGDKWRSAVAAAVAARGSAKREVASV